MKYLGINFTQIPRLKNWYRATEIADEMAENSAIRLIRRIGKDEHLICGRLFDEAATSLFLLQEIPLNQIVSEFGVGSHADRESDGIIDLLTRINSVGEMHVTLANSSACWLGFSRKISLQDALRIASALEDAGELEWYVASDLDSEEAIAADIVEKQMVYLWWD